MPGGGGGQALRVAGHGDARDQVLWANESFCELKSYPDELRLMLSGVQQVRADRLHDRDDRGRQLARIDDALVSAARHRLPGRPGQGRIVAGTIVVTIGVIGIVVGFASFVVLGLQSSSPGLNGDRNSPVVGWAVFMVSMLVAAIGGGIRQSGRRQPAQPPDRPHQTCGGLRSAAHPLPDHPAWPLQAC